MFDALAAVGGFVLIAPPDAQAEVAFGFGAVAARICAFARRVGHPAHEGVGAHAEQDLGARSCEGADPATGCDVVEPELIQREVVVARRGPDHRPDDRDRVGVLPDPRAGHRVERLSTLRDTRKRVVDRTDLEWTFAGVLGDVGELEHPRAPRMLDRDASRGHQHLQVGKGDRFGGGRDRVRGAGRRAFPDRVARRDLERVGGAVGEPGDGGAGRRRGPRDRRRRLGFSAHIGGDRVLGDLAAAVGRGRPGDRGLFACGRRGDARRRGGCRRSRRRDGV